MFQSITLFRSRQLLRRTALVFLVGMAFLSHPSLAGNFAVENSKLKKRFVYKADVEDTWTILADAGIVYGDCEDYALTLQKKVGGQLWYVKPVGEQPHMILCKKNMCADNQRAGLFPLDANEFEVLIRAYPHQKRIQR